MKKDNWITKAFLMTFFIALFFNTASNLISKKCNYIGLIIICFVFILIGVIFDMIGTAVLTANEATFHAKSSKKIKGSKECVYLIKNSNVISNICNDVIGDICGIITGSVSAILSIHISSIIDIPSVIIILIISSLVSSLTVGGKAIGKKYSIKKSDKIIDKVGRIINIFKR